MPHKYTYSIEKTWDNEGLSYSPVDITLEQDSDDPHFLVIKISAPFYNDPAEPSSKPGEFFELWNYEVVETFFLSDSGKNIELEFGPFNHYVVLLIQGPNKVLKTGLQLDYRAKIEGNRWTGQAKIPESYFPRRVTKMNAYAIHGSNESRVYKALYPTPHKKYSSPDFHRLDYFQSIDFKGLMPANWERPDESDIWLK